jgi:NhaA family Na+:H+ antiporter
MLGVALALVAGKPIGVFFYQLDSGQAWTVPIANEDVMARRQPRRVACGHRLTMSIFIATLAFAGAAALDAAKLAVLLGSFVAGCAGLV